MMMTTGDLYTYIICTCIAAVSAAGVVVCADYTCTYYVCKSM